LGSKFPASREFAGIFAYLHGNTECLTREWGYRLTGVRSEHSIEAFLCIPCKRNRSRQDALQSELWWMGAVTDCVLDAWERKAS
jgi:hypothetical protein